MASAAPSASVVVLITVLAMVASVSAKSNQCGGTCTETYPVLGRKYILQNRPIRAGEGVVCPEGKPSTVTFCKTGLRARIVGNFAAPDLGVCDPAINYMTLLPNDVVTYEQYGDMVVLRIPGRVASAFRVLIVDGKKVAVGVSNRFGVSSLTDCGPANC